MNWYDNNSNQVSFKITQNTNWDAMLLLFLLNYIENRQDQEKNLESNNGQKLENRIHPKLKLQHTSMTIYVVYT